METSKKNLINILKGVVVAIAFTLFFLLILSIVLTYTNISENWTSSIIIILTGISILIGSSISSMKLKKSGMVNGGLIGGIYFALIYLVSSILKNDFSVNIQMMIIILVGVIFGIIGGIIGVNKK